MDRYKADIAPQREFRTLREFQRHQGNFYRYFLPDHPHGFEYRSRPHFKRFRLNHIDIEEKVRMETLRAVRSQIQQKLPYRLLFEAYQYMTRFVCIGDKDVVKDGKVDDLYLTR